MPCTHDKGELMKPRTFLCLALVVCCARALAARTTFVVDGDIAGSVADSASGTPLPGGEVRGIREGTPIATAPTDAFRRYAIRNLPAGSHSVEVRYLGHRP